MSGVFQLLGTLRNKLRCTLRHLRQQLCHSLRASEIRLRRTERTDFLLRVPTASPRAPARSTSQVQTSALAHGIAGPAANMAADGDPRGRNLETSEIATSPPARSRTPLSTIH